MLFSPRGGAPPPAALERPKRPARRVSIDTPYRFNGLEGAPAAARGLSDGVLPPSAAAGGGGGGDGSSCRSSGVSSGGPAVRKSMPPRAVEAPPPRAAEESTGAGPAAGGEASAAFPGKPKKMARSGSAPGGLFTLQRKNTVADWTAQLSLERAQTEGADDARKRISIATAAGAVHEAARWRIVACRNSVTSRRAAAGMGVADEPLNEEELRAILAQTTSHEYDEADAEGDRFSASDSFFDLSDEGEDDDDDDDDEGPAASAQGWWTRQARDCCSDLPPAAAPARVVPARLPAPEARASSRAEGAAGGSGGFACRGAPRSCKGAEKPARAVRQLL